MSFNQFIADCQARIEAKLDIFLPASKQIPENLHTAMRYAALGGGKRVRPMLSYATGEALNIPADRLDAPAVAIEIMHTFSLIHDDLPAMDNDDLRRGKPSLHLAFDEATAILAADALQPLAFEILAADAALQATPDQRVTLMKSLAIACGSLGMTGGQSIDLQAEGQSLSKTEVEHMYKLKTGRLLHASVIMPASIGLEPSSKEFQQLERFIDDLGLAFQIRDDILDIEGSTETIGKPQGADQIRAKATWPALFGMGAAKQRTTELLESALAEIDSFGDPAEPLRQVANYIVRRSS
jgi:geranylgeranyl pyrophosphate synthase